MRARKSVSLLSLAVAASFAVGSVLVGATPAVARPVSTSEQQPPSLTAADPASDGSKLAAQTEGAASSEAVSTGDMVKVNTETGEYLSRA